MAIKLVLVINIRVSHVLSTWQFTPHLIRRSFMLNAHFISIVCIKRNSRPMHNLTGETKHEHKLPTESVPVVLKLTNEQTTNPFACQMKSIQSNWNVSYATENPQRNYKIFTKKMPKCLEQFTNPQRCHNFQ